MIKKLKKKSVSKIQKPQKKFPKKYNKKWVVHVVSKYVQNHIQVV